MTTQYMNKYPFQRPNMDGDSKYTCRTTMRRLRRRPLKWVHTIDTAVKTYSEKILPLVRVEHAKSFQVVMVLQYYACAAKALRVGRRRGVTEMLSTVPVKCVENRPTDRRSREQLNRPCVFSHVYRVIPLSLDTHFPCQFWVGSNFFCTTYKF